MAESILHRGMCDDDAQSTPLTPLSVWKERIATARQMQQQPEQDDDLESLATNVHYNEVIRNLTHYYYLAQTESTKEQILTVRTILRFVLINMGVPSESQRQAIQSTICQPRLLDLLGEVVVNYKQDSRSRVTACRVLTNLVTNNRTTSRTVLAYWPWQPSDQRRQQRIERSALYESSTEDSSPIQLSWPDLLLAVSTDREALAALVACWYNALQAVEDPPVSDVANAVLVISNLLRHLLPSSAVLTSHRELERSESDEATEWVTLLLCYLCRSGSLAKLYQNATGSAMDDSQQEDRHSSLEYVVPEQVLLLQALVSQMDAEAKTEETSSLLGDDRDRLQANVFFLARDLYPRIRQTLLSPNSAGGSEANSARRETTESLGPTTLSLIRELLADVLAHGSSQVKELRNFLGKDEVTVATWIQDLRYHYDKVQARSRGRPAKDVVLTDEEKRIFVSLVRLLGNLCHQSRINQDGLREAVAPPPDDRPDEDETPLRTGLHLLLSCTSLSHTCFTLREWSVVAIRNALDENVENQALVAELQAQGPAPSVPLDEMGVRLQMEKGGKVSLKPIEEDV